MLRRFTRGGVPVLKRRRGRPSANRLPVRALAACMPSGPEDSMYSPTMVRPVRYVPVQRMTAFTPNTAPVRSTTALTCPFSQRISVTSACRSVRFSCCSSVCFITCW